MINKTETTGQWGSRHYMNSHEHCSCDVYFPTGPSGYWLKLSRMRQRDWGHWDTTWYWTYLGSQKTFPNARCLRKQDEFLVSGLLFSCTIFLINSFSVGSNWALIHPTNAEHLLSQVRAFPDILCKSPNLDQLNCQLASLLSPGSKGNHANLHVRATQHFFSF